MLKNITLSAEERLIKLARDKATKEHTTINQQFRDWLERYVDTDQRLDDYDLLMRQLKYAQTGKKFTRDDMNER